MNGSGMPLQWAYEIEHSMWEVPMWWGPWSYHSRDDAEEAGRIIALVIAQANRDIGPDRRYDHFRATLRQVDWPTCWNLESGVLPERGHFYSTYIQPTLVKVMGKKR